MEVFQIWLVASYVDILFAHHATFPVLSPTPLSVGRKILRDELKERRRLGLMRMVIRSLSTIPLSGLPKVRRRRKDHFLPHPLPTAVHNSNTLELLFCVAF